MSNRIEQIDSVAMTVNFLREHSQPMATSAQREAAMCECTRTRADAGMDPARRFRLLKPLIDKERVHEVP
eukprot:5157516-Pleurochrysis_carterae.AAC.2